MEENRRRKKEVKLRKQAKVLRKFVQFMQALPLDTPATISNIPSVSCGVIGQEQTFHDMSLNPTDVQGPVKAVVRRLVQEVWFVQA